MTIHLVKLCVGISSVADLKDWQRAHLADCKRRGLKREVMHITRQMPKRADELLDGGSIYWVIKGQIAVRQRIVALRTVVRGDVPHCGIVLAARLVPTLHRFRAPFQGWRYLRPEDAPADLRSVDGHGMPDELKIKLSQLGLL